MHMKSRARTLRPLIVLGSFGVARSPASRGTGRSASRAAAESAGPRHARSSHRSGAPTQPFVAGGAYHDPGESGARNYGQPAAQSRAARRRAVSAFFLSRALSPATTWINSAQFDLGVGYLFERGKKRQHRLQAAKDQTAVTSATVDDNARTLTFNVASQFISAAARAGRPGFGRERSGEFPADRGHQPGVFQRPAP